MTRTLDPNHPLVQLGGFELLCMLGEGGYGIVFKGRDPKLDREVAIKLCLARNRRATRKLTREAQTLAKLKHPNIVAVYELGQHGEDVFIAMEYIAGSTADEFANSDPTLDAIAKVFCDVGRGLAAAHESGIVHRDVKPSNILIGDDDIARVADFGLARLYDPASAGHRRRFAPSGTPAYMAPEVLDRQMPDARSDQWAVGVSIWETCTKQSMFVGNRRQVRRQIRKQLAAKLADERVPAAIRGILRRVLALDPRKRYPSMLALVADLARLVPAPLSEPVSEPATAEVIELMPIALEVPTNKRRRGAFAVALVLVGTLLGWTVGAVRSESPRASADLRAIKPTSVDSPCVGVRRGDKVYGDRVMTTACEMIRDGDLVDATGYWDRERTDRDLRNEDLVRNHGGNAKDLDFQLAAASLPVARTFLDHAEMLSRDRTRARIEATLRYTIFIVLGPVDRSAAKQITRDVKSHVIYLDMKTAAREAIVWATAAKVASPLAPESKEIERRARLLLKD